MSRRSTWKGPDWSLAPSWARYWVFSLAIEQGFWLSHKPRIVQNQDFRGVEYNLGKQIPAPRFRYRGDPYASLRRRPT
jgi:hypothetical protein